MMANGAAISPGGYSVTSASDDADQKCADERPAKAAEAADDDDDRGQHQRIGAHLQRRRCRRDGHRAGKAGEERPQREHEREHAVGADANRGRHRTVDSRRSVMRPVFVRSKSQNRPATTAEPTRMTNTS